MKFILSTTAAAARPTARATPEKKAPEVSSSSIKGTRQAGCWAVVVAEDFSWLLSEMKSVLGPLSNCYSFSSFPASLPLPPNLFALLLQFPYCTTTTSSRGGLVGRCNIIYIGQWGHSDMALANQQRRTLAHIIHFYSQDDTQTVRSIVFITRCRS